MRNVWCFVFFLSCGPAVQAQAQRPLNALTAEEIAQGKVLLFDGKTTSGWMIEGDVDVKDGVLILGGTRKTRVRIAPDFSADFDLHLEYRTENKRPVQIEWETRHLFGRGMASTSLEGAFENPGKWIETVVRGEKHPARDGRLIRSEWRVLGEPEFAKQPLGGRVGRPAAQHVRRL
jgi:hypothetical protein